MECSEHILSILSMCFVNLVLNLLSFDAMAIPDARAGAKAMEETAKKWGFELQVSDVDQLGGSVSGTLSGDALLIAAFADALLDGKIDDTPVMMASFRPKAS